MRVAVAVRAVAAVLLAATANGCRGSAPESGLPTSIAALGDSITRAHAACEAVGDCPEASWSTGTMGDLRSHYQRLATDGRRISGGHNLAVSGATVADLDGQARRAVEARVEYVTVLIGANDACAASEDAMTPAGAFETDFRRAMTTLTEGLPRARILVVSVPDLARLWRVGKAEPVVRTTWERLAICQSMLADPLSTAGEAEARRGRVRERVVEYNRIMAKACGEHPTCRWDGDAVFDYEFSLDMVSPRDYWHPSLLGQHTLADLSWAAGYWP